MVNLLILAATLDESVAHHTHKDRVKITNFHPLPSYTLEHTVLSRKHFSLHCRLFTCREHKLSFGNPRHSRPSSHNLFSLSPYLDLCSKTTILGLPCAAENLVSGQARSTTDLTLSPYPSPPYCSSFNRPIDLSPQKLSSASFQKSADLLLYVHDSIIV